MVARPEDPARRLAVREMKIETATRVVAITSCGCRPPMPWWHSTRLRSMCGRDHHRCRLRRTDDPIHRWFHAHRSPM